MTPVAKPAQAFRVLRDDADVPSALKGAVAAIGNFDGVHRGHQAVIAAAVGRARALGRAALALTFEPHPRAFFRPQEPLFRLADKSAKLRLLAASGLDGVLVLTFDAAFAALGAEEFVRTILVERLAIAGAAIGYNFHFGRGREGTPAFLLRQGEAHGFAVELLPPLQHGGRPLSSSAIRSALAEGRVAEAAELLGHPWFVSGIVLHGDKRGRHLGYPTANLRLDPACGLQHGIYAVRVGLGRERHDGIASFGRRPTFDNGAPLLEVFLFDFTGDLYGATLDVAFVDWIRAERRFDSADELVRQMDEDSARARAVLAGASDAFLPARLPGMP
jgi:riboflavin kinase / FMN adenylyltransferase